MFSESKMMNNELRYPRDLPPNLILAGMRQQTIKNLWNYAITLNPDIPIKLQNEFEIWLNSPRRSNTDIDSLNRDLLDLSLTRMKQPKLVRQTQIKQGETEQITRRLILDSERDCIISCIRRLFLIQVDVLKNNYPE